MRKGPRGSGWSGLAWAGLAWGGVGWTAAAMRMDHIINKQISGEDKKGKREVGHKNK